jgi:TPP-dependent indolepyruvate ferredoxin oxidoreductase alpha subunit
MVVAQVPLPAKFASAPDAHFKVHAETSYVGTPLGQVLETLAEVSAVWAEDPMAAPYAAHVAVVAPAPAAIERAKPFSAGQSMYVSQAVAVTAAQAPFVHALVTTSVSAIVFFVGSYFSQETEAVYPLAVFGQL